MFDEIKAQIAEMLNIDEAVITADSNLITDLKAD